MCYRILILVALVFTVSCGQDQVFSVSPSPKFIQFSFLASDNPSLLDDVVMSIDGSAITGRLPDNVSVKTLVASFETNGAKVYVSDIEQISGQSQNDFTDIVDYRMVSVSETQPVNVTVDLLSFTGIPIVYISTEAMEVIDSRDDYVVGSVVVDGKRFFESFTAPMKIRGRGNSTWSHPKKPFQMKLNDKNSFLGMPEDKKWLFLAEYSDKTLLRNRLVFELGRLSSLDWTPSGRFAEVYINDLYNGTYNITQKVEEGKHRVDIGEGGFLLEIDQIHRLDPDDVYFYGKDSLFNIKEPNLQSGDTQYKFIENFLNQFEEALHGSDFADPEVGYLSYIDLDSFIDWYLINEISKNQDSVSWSSIYLTLKPGGKIKMGPLWDYDLSFGNVDYSDAEYPEGWWIKSNTWYARLFQDPVFVEKVKERFSYYKQNETLILGYIDMLADKLRFAQATNNEKWETIGMYVWPNPVVYDTYDEEVSHLKNWYSARMDWLDDNLSSL